MNGIEPTIQKANLKFLYQDCLKEKDKKVEQQVGKIDFRCHS